MFTKTPGVEYNVTKRWESGTPHHHKSVALMDRVKELDWDAIEGYFDFKTGGDGDNGEMLMYLLDIYFEENDNVKPTADEGYIPGRCVR